MKPHVKKVLNLWKETVSAEKSTFASYQLSPQLRNFAALFAPGLFYYYVLNFPRLELEFVHEGSREVLGIEPEDVTMENLIGFLAAEEREPMAQKEAVVVDFFWNYLDPGEALFYKSVYFFKIVDADGKKRNMLHQATVLTLTDNNEPEYVMVVHTDVSHLKFIDTKKVSFVSLHGKQSYFDVEIIKQRFDPKSVKRKKTLLKDSLTKREKEIIRLIGQGYRAEKIADELNISVHTVRTHRKNILNKSDCKNITELVAKCLIEGTI